MRKPVSLVVLAFIATFVAGFSLTAADAAAAPNQQRRRTIPIVVKAFLDTAGYNQSSDCPGCNGTWNSSDWCGEMATPLPPLELIVRDPDTDEEIDRVLTRKIRNTGQSWAYVPLQQGDSIILEVAEVPAGFEACPTSPLRRLITPSHYPYGHALISFYFWWGCPAEQPPREPPPPPGGDLNHFGCGVFPGSHLSP